MSDPSHRSAHTPPAAKVVGPPHGEAESHERAAPGDHKRGDTEDLFRLLVDSVRDYAIFMLDPSGRVATWNTGAQRVKGYVAEEIIGRHFSCFYPKDDIGLGKCELELEVAARDGRFEDEGWRLRKDGTPFWANVIISGVRDRQGTLVGFSKVTRDLTERRAAEEDRAARRAAEEASRAKDEFLAMLGHELRNPLAPIVTALHLIKLRGDPGAAKEYDVIERQVAHMVRLVDDLLDVSRITRGKVELKRRLVDVRDVVAKALEVAAPLLEQFRHHIVVDAPPAPLMVEGDEARLLQVFANLLTNAAKYTEPGGHVTVTLAAAGEQISVEVCDDGAGISPELLPRVFDLFVQGSQSSDRGRGGLGVGLTLVRSLVALHGGDVVAASPGIGHGSTFTVRLPTAAGAAEERAEVAPAAPRPAAALRILVVDDNEDACMLLSDILSSLGHEVRSAGDGAQALAAVRDFAPDLAVLDIGLPAMDGYELAAQLRAVLATPPRMIALSGYGQQSDRDRSQAAGFDRHLVKPVDMRRLLDAIAELGIDDPRR